MTKNNTPASRNHSVNDAPEISTTARRVLLALHELDGTLFENLIAVRTGLSATEVREVMTELREAELIAEVGATTDTESFDDLLAGL